MPILVSRDPFTWVRDFNGGPPIDHRDPNPMIQVEGARSAADEASAAQAALKKTSEEHESTATRTQMLREAVAMQVDEGQDLLMAVDGLDITEFQESVAEKSRDSLHMDAEDLFSAFLAQTPMTTTDSAAKDGKNAGTPPGTRGPRCA